MDESQYEVDNGRSFGFGVPGFGLIGRPLNVILSTAKDLGLAVSFGLRVPCFGLRVPGFGLRVPGFGLIERQLIVILSTAKDPGMAASSGLLSSFA